MRRHASSFLGGYGFFGSFLTGARLISIYFLGYSGFLSLKPKPVAVVVVVVAGPYRRKPMVGAVVWAGPKSGFEPFGASQVCLD